MKSCDSRTRAYKNGKTFDQCKQIAKMNATDIAKNINDIGIIQWIEILEKVNHDELVYKLTLKYLRQLGYNIGDWKNPQVTKAIV